jgi:hypothetical protein
MSKGEIILYTTEDGLNKVQLRAQDGTAWLTQLEMAELFQTSKQNISLHIKNILTEGELNERSTVKESLIVQTEGVRKVSRGTHVYNLDMILAVGYRVNSERGIQFRQWATTTLRDYLAKGFVMDDERLKEPGGRDYFDELLERIRDIRASEKRFYQKIKDIYALSADYKPNIQETKLFFQTVQNKLLWAVTGKTAAELLVERANSSLPNMGLTSWKGSQVKKMDVITAKNYLKQEEISELNRVVTMFLDFAEDQTKRRKTILMKDWVERLGAFLEFNDRSVLNHTGKISHDEAEKTVNQHYEKFEKSRIEQEFLESENEAMEDLKKIEQGYSEKKK